MFRIHFPLNHTVDTVQEVKFDPSSYTAMDVHAPPLPCDLADTRPTLIQAQRPATLAPTTQLQPLPYNRHYLIVTLQRLPNLDIHPSLKSHLLPLIFKPTPKFLMTNLNQREIHLLPIRLLVPQLLSAMNLPLPHRHPSHLKLLPVMKFRQLQRLTICHTLRDSDNRYKACLGMVL